MLIVRGTRKFLQRVPGARLDTDEPDTAALGEWYATVLFRRPHLALFVNKSTLLPVLVPLAPAATLLARFPQQLAETLAGYQLNPSFIDDQTATLYDARLAATRNRSVVGSMNEFTHLLSYADRPANHHDLSELAHWLAQTPCGHSTPATAHPRPNSAPSPTSTTRGRTHLAALPHLAPKISTELAQPLRAGAILLARPITDPKPSVDIIRCADLCASIRATLPGIGHYAGDPRSARLWP